METSELAQEIEQFFAKKGYSWRIQTDDGPRYIDPDDEDIQRVLDMAAERLYNEKEPAQLEVGRLTFKKAEGRIEVSALFGILGE